MSRKRKNSGSSQASGRKRSGKSWRAILEWSKTWKAENHEESSETTKNVTEMSFEMSKGGTGEAVTGSSEMSRIETNNPGVAVEEYQTDPMENGEEDVGSDIQFLPEVDVQPADVRSISIEQLKQKIYEHHQFLASVSTSNGSGIAPDGLPEMQGSQSSNSYASTSESEPPQRATEVGPETLLQLKNMLSELVSRKLAKLMELTRANRNDVETTKTTQENILGGLNHLIQRIDDFALLQNLVWKELEQLKTEVTGLRARQDEDLQYQQDSGTPMQPPSLSKFQGERKGDSSESVLTSETPIPSPSELRGKRKADSSVSVLISGTPGGAATPNENVAYETPWSAQTSSDSRIFVPSPTSSSCSVDSYLNLRSGLKKKVRYTRRRNKHGINRERK